MVLVYFLSFVLLSIGSHGLILRDPSSGGFYIYNGNRMTMSLNETEKMCQMAGGLLPGNRTSQDMFERLLPLVPNMNIVTREPRVWLDYGKSWYCTAKCCGRFFVKIFNTKPELSGDCQSQGLSFCEMTASLKGFLPSDFKQVNGLTQELKLITQRVQHTRDQLPQLEERIDKFRKELELLKEQSDAQRKDVTALEKEIQELTAVINEFKMWIKDLDDIMDPLTKIKKQVATDENKLQELTSKDENEQTKVGNQLKEMNEKVESSFTRIKQVISNVENAIKDLQESVRVRFDQMEEAVEKKERNVSEYDVFQKNVIVINNLKIKNQNVTKTRDETVKGIEKIKTERKTQVEDKIDLAEKMIKEYPEKQVKFADELGKKITNLDKLLANNSNGIQEEFKRRNQTHGNHEFKKERTELIRQVAQLNIMKQEYQSQIHTFKVTFYPVLGIFTLILMVQIVFVILWVRKRNLYREI